MITVNSFTVNKEFLLKKFHEFDGFPKRIEVKELPFFSKTGY